MKAMNFKRVASTALAGVLALSMAAPAFAAANTTTITGNYNEIKLAVAVPATGKAVINPYGLPFTIGSETVSGQQITTIAPLTIQNRSAVALKVTAEVTGTPSTGVTLESYDATDYADTVTDKKLKVQFQAFEAPTVTELNATDTEVLIPLFAALKDADAVLTADVTTTKADTTGDLILREGNADNELQAGGAAFFRLNGKAAIKATWTSTDNFSATIAYTFTPDTYAMNAGTIAGVGNTNVVDMSALGTLVLTLTPDSSVAGLADAEWEWSSSDETKATVAVNASDAKKATVTGIAAGAATITATATVDGQVYSASFAVDVQS